MRRVRANAAWMAKQRKRKGEPVHGWLNLDKPEDLGSTQAVSIVKRLFNAQKAGHGGTLDPLADGILPIAFGEATKTSAHVVDARKTYRFAVRWGASTTTQDREGEVTATSDHRPAPQEIEAALAGFVGEIEQVPPQFSAIKVDGERAYDLARDGETVELKSRPVEVFSAALIAVPEADTAIIEVTSGKGFYIRALARDLATALGTEGHVRLLRRLSVGRFDEAQSITLDQLRAIENRDDLLAVLMPVETALEGMASISLSPAEASDVRMGREVVLLPHVIEGWKAARANHATASRETLALSAGKAVALGEVRAGHFAPSRVFQM